MKTNKLKLLSISICSFVAALWSAAQCMDPPEAKNDTPAGTIMAFAGGGEKAPDGWLFCYGQQFSSLTYPELYEVVKERYAPENERVFLINRNRAALLEKTFYVPDLRGRVIVGVDKDGIRVTSNNKLGDSGGEEKHQLTEAELAAHSHPLPSSGGPGVGIQPRHAGAIDFSLPMGKAGGDQPHNNMQPYQVLNYIISTGQANGQQQKEMLQLRKNINQLEVSQQGCAKAWVVFNGSAKILDGYGVSSVIRNSVGDYTIKFSKPFSSENYCSILNSGNGVNFPNTPWTVVSGPYRESPTRDSFRCYAGFAGTWGAADPSFVSACFYGNQ